MMFNSICVVGLGYIGLPTAAMFASKGKSVLGVDVSQHVVNTINSGNIHIVEPSLDIIVEEAIKSRQLRASTSAKPADAFLIAVPTPFKSQGLKSTIPQPDLSYIKAAAKEIARVLKSGDLVVLESTSPVGTTDQMAAWLSEERKDLTFPQTHGDESDIRVAYCPERVLPGNVIRELVTNDRVIGGMTNNCTLSATELYKIFVEGECVTTNARTAEMSKLVENASRDVAIAFANELSIICDSLDINALELISLANRHPRVNILQPGCGVGGHCIAVDPWFIVSESPDTANLIETARRVNDYKPFWVIDKVRSAVADFSTNKIMDAERNVSIACYGLAFKPDIDDLRESPALLIAQTLGSTHSGEVYACEPHIESYDGAEFDLVDAEFALSNADIHVFLVKHSQLLFVCKHPFSILL